MTNETLPIVEKLRERNRLRIDAGNEWAYDNLADEAADTIERLVEALDPFAKAGKLFEGPSTDFDQCIYNPAAGSQFALSGNQLRKARETLAQVSV